ncbi:hypothetical protein Q8A73_003217 [Channa argus]|nr:hypothetical protein Q8A73_003217 [Channa argus]
MLVDVRAAGNIRTLNRRCNKVTGHEIKGCGGPWELSGESGTFTSWNYSNRYNKGKSCTWDITVDPNKNCMVSCYIILVVSVAKYCAYTKPKPVVSLTNPLTIFFNKIAGADGFLQGDQKDLMTPGFPEQNYPNAALCKRVRLTFTSFDLVPEVCAVFVEVFDTLCQCLPPFIIRIISVKAKFCGRTKPKPVESNSNIMVLRFEFDITLNSKGFRATYIRFRPVVASTTTQSPTTSKTQASSLPTTTASGGPIILQGCEGVIQSVGFPNPYPAHLNSSWKISVPKGFLVKLQIPEMAITGETGQCKEDKFVILDRYSVLGTHCGYILPPVMISPSDTISVTFQSDNRLTDRGFSAKWEAVYPEDIGEINSLTNALIQIMVRPLCGTKLPTTIRTKGNRLVIRFHTDLFSEAKGFRAYWTTNNLPAPTEPPVHLCGRPAIPPHVMSGIVNGDPARPHSWLWQVSMQYEGFRFFLFFFLHVCITSLKHLCLISESSHWCLCFQDTGAVWNLDARFCFGKGCNQYKEICQMCFITEVWSNSTRKMLCVVPVELFIYQYHCVLYDTVALMCSIVKSSMICCGYTLPDELKSVCQDTPGGPWEVHGIASFMNKPSVFTHISAYLTRTENVMPSGCGGLKDLNGIGGTVSSMGDPEATTTKLTASGTSSFSTNDKVVDTGFSATWKAVKQKRSCLFFCTFPVLSLLFFPVVHARCTHIHTHKASCGGSFSNAQGEVTSPNWPSDYEAQSLCTRHITIPSAKSIHVAFTHFKLQAYLETMLTMCRFCGFVPPPQHPYANQQQGFRGYWTTDASVIPVLAPPPPNPWDDIIIMVNVEEAIPHSWQVSMQVSSVFPIPYMHSCGGSLIHEERILTVSLILLIFFTFNLSPTVHHCAWGSTTRTPPGMFPQQRAAYKVDGIIRHEGFVCEQVRTDITNDIVLVHFGKACQYDEGGQPKPRAVMPAGASCFVTSWRDKKGSVLPKIAERLKQAALPITDFQTCSKPAYWWDTLRPSMISAGYESPHELKSACQGDSGGPFTFVAPGTSTTWEVHGVVSFRPLGCIKDSKPSVFSRLSAFSDWVNNNIKKCVSSVGEWGQEL